MKDSYLNEIREFYPSAISYTTSGGDVWVHCENPPTGGNSPRPVMSTHKLGTSPEKVELECRILGLPAPLSVRDRAEVALERVVEALGHNFDIYEVDRLNMRGEVFLAIGTGRIKSKDKQYTVEL